MFVWPALLLVVIISTTTHAQTGPPQDFGYYWANSPSVDCQYNWEELVGNPSAAVLGNAGLGALTAVSFSMPFDFRFYVATIRANTTLHISPDGYISLNQTAADNDPTVVPGIASSIFSPFAVLQRGPMLLWTDVIRVATLDSAPNRRLIVQWHTSDDHTGAVRYRFQMKLFENSTRIEYHYNQTSSARWYRVFIQSLNKTQSFVDASQDVARTPSSAVCFLQSQNPPPPIGAPDDTGFGYRYFETYEDCPFSYENITGLSFNTNAAGNVSLPFSFWFYGSNYTRMWLTTGGFASFTRAYTTTVSGPTFPLSGAAHIAPFQYEELQCSITPTFATLGTAPNRRFIAQWACNDRFSTTRLIRFQLKLFESSNDIQFHYLVINGTSSFSEVAVGLQHPNTTAHYLNYYSGGQGRLQRTNWSVCIKYQPRSLPALPTTIATVGAPDAFGYQWVTNNASCPVDYEHVNLTSFGMQLFSVGNGPLGHRIDLPFNFSYYGRLYSSLSVSLAGALNFIPLKTEWLRESIYPTYYTAHLAPLLLTRGWHIGSTNYWVTRGTAPNRRVVLQFDLRDAFSFDQFQFQVKLFESTNQIQFQYSLVSPSSFEASIGILSPTNPNVSSVVFFGAPAQLPRQPFSICFQQGTLPPTSAPTPVASPTPSTQPTTAQPTPVTTTTSPSTTTTPTTTSTATPTDSQTSANPTATTSSTEAPTSPTSNILVINEAPSTSVISITGLLFAALLVVCV